ncbi:MAG TPA: Asp-tRNA(Asn)/Glu-tRNA(Gln) amidotransferase subunit GatC [Polyangia bacterium]|nr:Asp-tRNA(Asn)/Glu-tRNA(Gln) amidotransferase subunit GatC [Polyangia bacterium]
MSRIKPEEVREIATLARLRLTDQEVDRMTHDLDAILGYVAALKELDTSDVEPMTHAVPFDCPLRPDVAQASLPLDDALKNAPRREASFFQVPRIIASSPSSGGGGDVSGGGSAGEDLP